MVEDKKQTSKEEIKEKSTTELKQEVVKLIKETGKIKKSGKVGFKGITIIPNEQELYFAGKLNMRNVYSSPVAVRNRKVKAGELLTFANQGQVERTAFEAIIQAYPNHKFMYHPQFREGTVLNAGHLQTIDDAQDTEKSPYFLIYQESADNPILHFINRLITASNRFSHKILVPVLDPATKDLIELRRKALAIALLGYQSVAVLYRNPNNCLDGWSVIQSILSEANIETFCISIYFRWTTDKKINPGNVERISNLCSPLIFGCLGVAHYMPWSGGPVADTLLENNMFYEVTGVASAGRVRYNRQNRVNVYNNIRASGRYHFCRVDAIIQAQAIMSAIPQITPANLPAISTRVDGVGYFANKWGLI